jgi:hypothetical protein
LLSKTSKVLILKLLWIRERRAFIEKASLLIRLCVSLDFWGLWDKRKSVFNIKGINQEGINNIKPPKERALSNNILISFGIEEYSYTIQKIIASKIFVLGSHGIVTYSNITLRNVKISFEHTAASTHSNSTLPLLPSRTSMGLTAALLKSRSDCCKNSYLIEREGFLLHSDGLRPLR